MVEFDPFAESYFDDPFPVYERLRNEARAYHHEALDCYFLSRFEDIWEAVGSGHFSHRKGTNTQDLLAGKPPNLALSSMTPPRHTALRKVLWPFFSPSRTRALEPMVRDYAACFIDAEDAACSLEEAAASPYSLAARTEHFSGAELAGLVRSAASFALGRAAIATGDGGGGGGESVQVRRSDFEAALCEVLPARGRRDEALRQRFERHGVECSAYAAARRRLRRFVSPAATSLPRSALLLPKSEGAAADGVKGDRGGGGWGRAEGGDDRADRGRPTARRGPPDEARRGDGRAAAGAGRPQDGGAAQACTGRRHWSG